MTLAVAVIGAGAAGLVTARELTRAGHRVQLFEQSAAVGGVWVYSEATEADPLGESGPRVHSSLYPSLRTNLPRDLMAFLDYPFDSSGGGNDAWPRFPGHACVREYLERFARDHDLLAMVEFGAPVVHLARDGDGWSITLAGGRERRVRAQAVAVCSGHYADPRVPDLPGAATFPGRRLHSHNYRSPEPFRGRRVAVLGASASGIDLSREIAGVARSVFWCGRAFDGLSEAQRGSRRLRRVPAIAALHADGSLTLTDGSRVDGIDDLVYCTGYRYRYPFLEGGLVTTDDNWVRPLYRDLLHADDPTLAFIGIPFRVVPFPLFEMQARWFARLLRGDFRLPPAALRRAHTDAAVERLRANGVAPRHYHQRTIDCFDYLDELADESGAPHVPPWFRDLATAFLAHAAAHPTDLRERPFPHCGPTRVPVDSMTAVEDIHSRATAPEEGPP